jgi:hypothetical protein
MISAGFAFGLGFGVALFVLAVPCAYALLRIVRWLDP